MPPITPPKPDGGIPNFDDISSGAASAGTTAKTDIWSIPGDLAGKQIYTSYPSSVNQQTKRHLEGADQDILQASGTLQGEKFGIDPNTSTPNNTYALPISMFGDNPADYVLLQRQLYAAGYFGAKALTSMRWGGDVAGTMEAWTALLRDTVQQQTLGRHVTWQDVLKQTIETTKKAGGVPGSGAQKPASVFSYTDPAAIAAQAQQAAQAVLGHNLSDDEIKHFVSEFHAAELKYSEEQNAVRLDTTGGSYNVTQPDLSSQAQEFVEEGHGTEAAGNRMSDYVSALEQMVGSS